MFEKEIWIAKRNKVTTNKNGVEKEFFEKPQKFYFNYQPVSGNTKLEEYGEDINNVYRMFVDRKNFQGKIRVGDRAYLSDGDISEQELEELATNDDEKCTKANYRIEVVLPQNIKTRIDLIKIRSCWENEWKENKSF